MPKDLQRSLARHQYNAEISLNYFNGAYSVIDKKFAYYVFSQIIRAH